MIFWDGSRDSTNFYSDNYLQVNSCGVQMREKGLTVMREHGRRDYHIVLMLDGECQVEYDNIKYTMKKGDYIMFPPHTRHFYSYPTPNLSLWCHFTGSAVNEILQQCGIKPGINSFTDEQRVAKSFYNLMRVSNNPTDITLKNSAFLEFLHYISPCNTPLMAVGDRRIERTVSFIHTNYADNITLDMLANSSGYSKSRFSSIFKSVIGCSPMQYLNKTRLSYAADLLLSSKLSIREIASSCGFNDPFYFSRAFHKQYKCSPSEYISASQSIQTVMKSSDK